MINFMPVPLCPRGKSPQYPFNRELGGSQGLSGQFGEEINTSCPFLETKDDFSVVLPLAKSLYRLSNPCSLADI
jgi:hypothetical protein